MLQPKIFSQFQLNCGLYFMEARLLLHRVDWQAVAVLGGVSGLVLPGSLHACACSKSHLSCLNDRVKTSSSVSCWFENSQAPIER